MNESAEVLLKQTRYELEEIAQKLGINTVSLAKTKIAQSILEARKKAKITPKAAPPKIKAAPRVEPIKQKPEISVGKNGVFAKCAAIDAQINENNEAVALIGVGIDEINNGIKEIRSDLEKKARKMLKDGASNLQKGVKEMNNGIREMEASIDRKNKEIQTGVKVIHTGIHEVENKFEDFRTETTNYKHDFYYG